MAEKDPLQQVLKTLNGSIVPGGKKTGIAHVIGIVTARKRSTIPTRSTDSKGEERKVLVNKITYSVVSPDMRTFIQVDYFNPPTIRDSADAEGVPLPDKSKLIAVVEYPINNPVLSVIPVTSTKYGWGFASEDDKFAGEDF